MELLSRLSLFQGYLFWIGCILVCIPAIVALLFERRIKYYTLIISIFVIACIYHGSDLFFLIAFLILEIGLIFGYRSLRQQTFSKQVHAFVATIIICCAVAPLVITRITETFVPTLSLGFLGISYITFRVIQILLDIYDKQIDNINLFDLLLFLIYAPTISSGPIDRSARFWLEINTALPRREYLDLLAEGLLKIMIGLFYNTVLALLCYKALTHLSHMGPVCYYLSYLYLYGLYLFFDFAGYSLMAIGLAYVLGVRIPINFNRPFIARDIKEFWDRWHITLSSWFRDYVFSRIVMLLFRKKLVSSRLSTAVIGYCSTMGIMGFWHGLTPSYIAYGLYHGILLSLNELYQKKSKLHKHYKSNRFYHALSVCLTFQLVMVGFFIFSGKGLELVTAVWKAFS